MIEVLTKRMGLPQSAYLGRRINKKLFQENAKLGATDKKALREDVEAITWEYTLKPSTIPIKPYADNQQEYVEIAIIQVILKSRDRTGRLSEIIHRAIPYPVVLVLADETSVCLSLATKRFSHAEKGAIVAGTFFATDWIDPTGLSAAEESFLDSLAVASLPNANFKASYDALIDRVIALDCAVRTGSFVLESAAGRAETRRAALADCRDLEARIAEERAALNNETQFNRQVDGNMRIKEMERELAQKVHEL